LTAAEIDGNVKVNSLGSKLLSEIKKKGVAELLEANQCFKMEGKQAGRALNKDAEAASRCADQLLFGTIVPTRRHHVLL
jgi:hypothetical protein